MPTAIRVKNAFTLIEFLIALVIIGFIVAILVGVFSNPLKQAKTDSAVMQVKDGLRQLADAINLAAAKGGTCCYRDTLVASGLLSAVPAIPAGIGGLVTYGRGADYGSMIGGCGLNHGALVTVRTMLRNVSEQFCKDYNAGTGLPAAALSNCADTPGSCASGSTEGNAPVDVRTTTFCYQNGAGEYNIVYNTGVPGSIDSEGGGDGACP